MEVRCSSKEPSLARRDVNSNSRQKEPAIYPPSHPSTPMSNDIALTSPSPKDKIPEVSKKMLGTVSSEPPLLCKFDSPHDPTNPFDWSSRKKRGVVVMALLYSIMTGLNIGLYNATEPYIAPRIHCSDLVFRLGITSFGVAVALSPLILAPFSEVYGRRYFYSGSIFIYCLSHFAQVYPINLGALLVARAVMGASGAVGNTLVAGSIADIYRAHERGWLMAAFSLTVFGMIALSPFIGTVICSNLGWQWVGWLSIIGSGALTVVYLIWMPETRGNVLLYKKKMKLEKETGEKWTALGEIERNQSWHNLVRNSLVRPIYFLVYEPIVLSLSLWLGFLWGVLFLLLESVPLVMAQYNFTKNQQGLAFMSVLVGASISCIAAYHQEYLYGRDEQLAKLKGERVKPESRLYHAMAGGIGFPVGAFVFAWTGRPMYPWIAPCIGIALMGASIYPPYQAIFVYLADVYETYSSSALACQSFLRNVGLSVFVIFAPPLYLHFPPSSSTTGLNYACASTLMASLGILLGSVPFLLFFTGEKLRRKSKIASKLAGAGEGLIDDAGEATLVQANIEERSKLEIPSNDQRV